jgi:hypothetical protein
MKKELYIIICLSVLVFSSTAIASECSDKCQELGDSYYEECLESVSRGERPSEYLTWPDQKKFQPPEPGYPTQKYCYDYAKLLTDESCFNKCPEEMDVFYGPYQPKYHRVIKSPEQEKRENDQSTCKTKCLANTFGKFQDDCLKTKSEKECNDLILEEYLKCERECENIKDE